MLKLFVDVISLFIETEHAKQFMSLCNRTRAVSFLSAINDTSRQYAVQQRMSMKESQNV